MNILSTANNPLEHLHLEHHQDLELQVEAEKHIRQYSPGPVRRAEVQISHHPQLSSIIILQKKSCPCCVAAEPSGTLLLCAGHTSQLEEGEWGSWGRGGKEAPGNLHLGLTKDEKL